MVDYFKALPDEITAEGELEIDIDRLWLHCKPN